MSDILLEKKRNEAVAYYDMGRYEQAAGVFKEILAETPEDPLILFLLANCCFMLDRYAEAERICMDIAASYLAVSAFRLLGKIYREKKRYKKAEECFLKSLELDPQNADTLAEYAFLLLICGYRKKANDVMKEAERLDPEDSTVLHYKFYFNLAHGSRKEELAVIEQYFTNSSDEVQKLIKLGLTEYKSDRYKSSREYFRQAFVLEPTNKYILDMLEELDRINHFIFFPNRLFQRMHPVMRFLGLPAAIVAVPVVMLSLGLEAAGTALFVAAFAGIILLNLWSWLSGPIYKYIIKEQNKQI